MNNMNQDLMVLQEGNIDHRIVVCQQNKRKPTAHVKLQKATVVDHQGSHKSSKSSEVVKCERIILMRLLRVKLWSTFCRIQTPRLF